MVTLTWHPEIRDYTFNIAGRLFMGSDDSSQKKLASLFEELVKGLFSINYHREIGIIQLFEHCSL